MFRIIKGKVYGVLTDYDLASWANSLTNDYTKTSQQRTGTPPFMAHGLLDGSDLLHLYRHDVESLFYIMLILATHYEIQAPKKNESGGVRLRKGLRELPYQTWFDHPSYKGLADSKKAFFLELEHLNLSPTFEGFRGWLLHLQASFNCGFQAKIRHDSQQKIRERLMAEPSEQTEDEVKPVAFDGETLGGHLTYSTLIRPARRPTGALKGLVIRYDPPSSPSASPTGAV